MASIIFRLVSDTDSPLPHYITMSDIPTGYPEYPYSEDETSTSLKNRKKMWEIYLQIYRRKVEEGDSKACVDIVGLVQNELISVTQISNKSDLSVSRAGDDDPFPSFYEDKKISTATDNMKNITQDDPILTKNYMEDFDFPEFGDLPDLSAQLNQINFSDVDPLDFDDW